MRSRSQSPQFNLIFIAKSQTEVRPFMQWVGICIALFGAHEMAQLDLFPTSFFYAHDVHDSDLRPSVRAKWA